MRPGAVRDRIYADFLMPSRLEAYRAMVGSWLEAGYAVDSVEGFWRATGDGASGATGRHVVLRHDVDTDPRTAAAMWAVDRSSGIAASYYFRLSTIDVELMGDIAAGGGEASYHFEELAAVAKRRHLRDPQAARAAIPEAQERFRRNIDRLRAATGLPMRVVASHGDFVNRRLGIPNWSILADPAFRRTVEIDLETYDDAFARHVSSRHSDTHHPRYWVGEDPAEAIGRGDQVVYVLVHPRHWHARRRVNARDDAWRLAESLAYRLPAGGGGR
jgi:hypothetical protein